jgi:protein-S-isoprenylcysteine O-methyltransferase Ste14
MNIPKYQKVFGVGPIGILIGLISFGLIWLLDRHLGRVMILRQANLVRIIGASLIAIWICWHSWCVRTISQWWRHDKLCTAGPFRFVKHPMYSGAIWFAWLGVSLLFNSWIMLLQPVIAYFVTSLLVRKEEAMMATVFGEEYRIYAARTVRLFPRLF